MGLSLWLVPTRQEEIDVLTEESLALRHFIQAQGLATPSAEFPPHVTLLSGLEANDGWTEDRVWQTMEEGLQRWSDGRQKDGELCCELQEVTTRGLYFQCILIALRRADGLMGLNACMRHAFSAHEQPAYFPHCSLLYAHLSHEQAQTCIEAMANEAVLESRPEGGITFGRAKGPRKRIERISLGRVELWDTNGTVDNWRRVRERSL